MMIAAVSAALLGSQLLVVPVSDRVPELKVEAMCKATTADDKANGIALPQSFADCMRDETTAQQQLNTVWGAAPSSLRNSCEVEATSGGSQSYVDLLTCIQMAEWVKSPSTATRLRGAGKDRNSK
ncbi:hypothetical protein [Bradyrhizobium iriomotense]|uniref:UrcA family protein n=1 Tax=Bradyrhizobium iriomotense TaxID=441950 RepID=A0ABQ6B153_9BRAD|nr:hypothetical protein [Bradyrhizobium iriomotense]GLR88025.1 hypothetical protein GCM10007857_47370 [Bradyrhizobium iriomotense]